MIGTNKLNEIYIETIKSLYINLHVSYLWQYMILDKIKENKYFWYFAKNYKRQIDVNLIHY